MLSICMFVAAVAAPTAPANSHDAWHANYSEAVAETKQESQPLLVVFDKFGDEAAELDPSLLSAESGAFPLDSYALCHIDATTDYGKQVAEGFKVTEFPHVAIIDKSGSVVLRRVSGDISQKEWTKVLKEHKNGDRSSAAPSSTVSHTVAKPVASSTQSFTPSVSMPSYSQGGYSKPYCPSCQLRNR